MRTSLIRLFALFVVATLITVGSTQAVFAVDEYIQKPTFWNWVSNQGNILNGIVAYGLGLACPNTEDGYHRASEPLTTSQRAGRTVYSCICDYCATRFDAFEDDLNQSYQEQTSELPAQGYTSDGGLVFPFEVISHGIGSGTNQLSGCDGHIRGSSSYSSYVVYYHCDTNSIAIQLQSGDRKSTRLNSSH